MKLYSYNQLEAILGYFEPENRLEEIDENLQKLFINCEYVHQAQQMLEDLPAENFSRDLWKVAKTLDWRKVQNKRSKMESKGVEVHEGNIIKMGRLKMKLKTIKLPHTNSKHAEPTTPGMRVNKQAEPDAAVDVKDVSIVLSDKNEEIPPCRICLSCSVDAGKNQ